MTHPFHQSKIPYELLWIQLTIGITEREWLGQEG